VDEPMLGDVRAGLNARGGQHGISILLTTAVLMTSTLMTATHQFSVLLVRRGAGWALAAR
jgi:hypothetical protein